VYKDEYLLDDGSGNNKKIVLATAYYKIIMRLTTLDTKLTNRALRDVIKDLPSYALTVSGDIDAIHKRFNDTYAMLKARGEDIEDKEQILFETYSYVPDAVFRDYMSVKQTAYEEDVNDMRGADWNVIMKKASAKHKLLLNKKDHTWGSPSKEEGQMLALKAEILEVKDKNLQLSKALQSKLKNLKKATPADGANDTVPDAPPNPRKPNQRKTRNQKDRSNKQRQNLDEAWKKVPPKANESKSKQHGNKTWNWCKHHQAWCIHKESECNKGRQFDQRTVANQATVNEPDQDMSQASTLNPAYQQMLAHLGANVGE
jgi:hypothetical protein